MAKRIPKVDVEAMNVDPGTYPSLGADTDASTEKSAAPEKAAPAAKAAPTEPKAAESKPSAATGPAATVVSDTAPSTAAAAAASAPASAATASAPAAGGAAAMPTGQPAPAEAGAFQTALVVAIAAAVLAVVALGAAWWTHDKEQALTAQLDLQVESERQARHAVAAGLALQQLAIRVRAGGSFAQELQVTGELVGDDPAARKVLDALSPFADQGLPSLKLLQESFSQAILQPARRAIPATLMASFSNFIGRVLPSARSEAAVPQAGLEELFAAEHAVLAGDLPKAIEAAQPYLYTLPLAQKWVAIAEYRLEAEKAVTDIDALVWRKLGDAR